MVVTLTLAAAALSAQTPATQVAPSADAAKAALTFEVASVKQSGPLDPQKIMSGQMRIGLKVDQARVDIGSLALLDLIYLAFKVKPYQVSGGPSWLNSGMNADRFNIQAKMPEGAKAEQVPEMLQALLAERFQLKFHRDSSDQSVFALVVGKGGAKLKESPKDEETPAPPPGTINQTNEGMRMSGNPGEKGGMTMKGPNGNMRMTMEGGVMHMVADKMTIEQFADTISRFVDRPVVDMTEIKGTYQIAIDLSMEDMMKAARAAGVAVPPGGLGGGPVGPGGAAAAEAAADPGGSTIFQSVQQLGLKLEPRKSPIGKLIIDHIEKAPTEN